MKKYKKYHIFIHGIRTRQSARPDKPDPTNLLLSTVFAIRVRMEGKRLVIAKNATTTK